MAMEHFQRYKSLPAYGAGETFPFIRDSTSIPGMISALPGTEPTVTPSRGVFETRAGIRDDILLGFSRLNGIAPTRLTLAAIIFYLIAVAVSDYRKRISFPD
jgi:hypothetical protein